MKSNQTATDMTLFHSLWVRSTHIILTFSVLALIITGIEMIMVHPRFYWGEAGNDLTPALFELPFSRNYQHGGWDKSIPFFDKVNGKVSAARTYDIFNKNGWGRSLHFLAGWFLVISGLTYLIWGTVRGHLRKNIWPGFKSLSLPSLWNDLKEHLISNEYLSQIKSKYGLLQKTTYSLVIFIFMPLVFMTGITMSPAITAAYPFLLKIFLGAQSARTLHLFISIALVLFLIIHIIMVIRSGFKQNIRNITIGK